MWINTQSLKTYATHSDVRTDFPAVSLPAILTDAILEEIGVCPVERILPAHNPITQSVNELSPALVGDKWVQQWEVYTLPAEVVTANLACARVQKWEAIKQERDRRKYLGVKVGQHWFHSDDPSRIQQLALAMMGNAIPAGLMWKTLTTTPPPVFIEMTPALAQGIFMATAASDTAVFAAAELHRVAMEASDRPDLYDCTSGWPASIEDAP